MVYFPSTVNAPGAASYAAPLVNFAPIGDLADSYFKGTQNKQTLDQQNAFPNGLPRDAQGNVDTTAIVDKAAKVGGLPMVQGLLPFLLAQGGGQSPAPYPDAEGGQKPQFAQPAAPQSSQPVQPGASVPATGPSAARSPIGGYRGGDSGTTSVTSVISQRMPEELAGPVINRVAGRLGVDPNAPLDMNDPRVRQTFAEEFRGTQVAQADAPGSDTPPQAQSGNAQGPNGLRTQPANPQQAQPQQQPSLAPRPVQTVSVKRSDQPSTMPAAGNVPLEAQRLTNAASKALNEAERIGKFDPTRAAALTKRAEVYANQAQEIIKASQPTPDMRNAAASGVVSPIEADRVKEQNKNEADRMGKRYDALTNKGHEADAEIPKLELTQQIMSDPKFYSGPGEAINLGYKRILASIDPAHANDAQPQEMFRKVMQDSIRSNIQAMAASGVGRIMLSEVRIIEKSNANPEHTPATNRSLVEINKRTHEFNRGIAQLAENYNGGRLDPKFDAAVHDYVKAHPMFSKEEMNDPRLLGAPYAPSGIKTPEQAQQWGQQMGLREGDAIKLPNGKYGTVPRLEVRPKSYATP